MNDEKEQRAIMKKDNEEADAKKMDIIVEDTINKDIDPPANANGKYSYTQVKRWSETGEDRVIAAKIYHLACSGALRREVQSTLKLTSYIWGRMMNMPDSLYLKAIAAGEKRGIGVVVDGLKNKALGYDYEETTKGIRNGKVVDMTQTKHMPADVKAISLYLGKKLPAEWGSKDGMVINNDNRKIVFEDMPIELRKGLMEFMDKKENDKEIKTEEVIDV
jgi:hypothetical protein